MNKVYVDVVAEFRKDGRLVPIFFTWEDGRKYSIDRILKIERCASRNDVHLYDTGAGKPLVLRSG